MTGGVPARPRSWRRATQRCWAALAPKRDRIEATLVGLRAHGVSDNAEARHVVTVGTVWPGLDGAEPGGARSEGLASPRARFGSAGTVEPSPVLLAMLGAEDAKRTAGLSMGDVTTEEIKAHAIGVFAHVNRALGRRIRNGGGRPSGCVCAFAFDGGVHRPRAGFTDPGMWLISFGSGTRDRARVMVPSALTCSMRVGSRRPAWKRQCQDRRGRR